MLFVFFFLPLGLYLTGLVTDGIIIAAMGGSRIEAWMPRESLAVDEPGKTFLQNDADLDDLPETQKAFFGIDANQHLPSRLYNGMLTPLMPIGLRGVLWYQGESSAHSPGSHKTLGRRPDASDYGRMLTAMIASWRKGFGRDDLGFVIIQLPIQHPTVK